LRCGCRTFAGTGNEEPVSIENLGKLLMQRVVFRQTIIIIIQQRRLNLFAGFYEEGGKAPAVGRRKGIAYCVLTRVGLGARQLGGRRNDSHRLNHFQLVKSAIS
jgi:hypothetical protein